MKLLFISSFLLYPHTRFGGSKRLFLFARELAKRHELHLLHTDGNLERAHFEESGGSPFPHSLFVPIDHRTPHRGRARIVGAFLDYRDQVGRFDSMIGGFLGQTGFDAVLAAYPLALSLTDRFRTHPNLVYLEDDLLFEQVRKEAAACRGVVARTVKRFSYWKVMRYYRRQLAPVRTFVSISPEEDRIAGKQFPRLRRVMVGYGIDPGEYAMLAPPPLPHSIGFIGNFSHTPNLTALDHFLKDIFPRVRERFPDTEFFIAGPGLPADRISRYRSEPLHLLGAVADIRELYSKISVFVNPIVSGRGLRTKLIEAAAFGRPIVSTGLGAEGLNDLTIRRAETAREFSDALGELWGDPARLAATARENRSTVERLYSLEAGILQLERALFT